MKALPETYTFRPGKFKYNEGEKTLRLKSELERKAVDKGIKLPELVRRVLVSYIKKNPPKK